MTKRIVKIVCKAFGLPVPTKYLPGRVVTFTAAELAYLNSAYDQNTAGQW